MVIDKEQIIAHSFNGKEDCLVSVKFDKVGTKTIPVITPILKFSNVSSNLRFREVSQMDGKRF